MLTTKEIFADAGEVEVAQLLSGSITPSGAYGSHYCVISNKRLYYKGMAFTANSRMHLATSEHTVNLSDISCSGFTTQKNIGYMIFAILFLLAGGALGVFAFMKDYDFGMMHYGAIALAVFAILFFLLYFLAQRKIFIVCFPGGELSFPANHCKTKVLHAFNSAIRVAIDNARNNSTHITVEIPELTETVKTAETYEAPETAETAETKDTVESADTSEAESTAEAAESTEATENSDAVMDTSEMQAETNI